MNSLDRSYAPSSFVSRPFSNCAYCFSLAAFVLLTLFFAGITPRAQAQTVTWNNASVLGTGSYSLGNPGGVTVDGAGKVYIADALNNRVLKVTAGGTATELSLTGLTGGTTDNGCSSTEVCASLSVWRWTVRETSTSRICTTAVS